MYRRRHFIPIVTLIFVGVCIKCSKLRHRVSIYAVCIQWKLRIIICVSINHEAGKMFIPFVFLYKKKNICSHSHASGFLKLMMLLIFVSAFSLDWKLQILCWKKCWFALLLRALFSELIHHLVDFANAEFLSIFRVRLFACSRQMQKYWRLFEFVFTHLYLFVQSSQCILRNACVFLRQTRFHN